MTKRLVLALSATFVLAALAAAAGSAGGSVLKGTITADGSSTVGPYTTAAAEAFHKLHSKVNVTVGISGTGGGFERFCRGEIDLADASRPIKPSESKTCADKGIKWVAFTVANDGIAIVVNKQNTWATLPHRRPAARDVEAGLERGQLEGRQPELPGRGPEALRAGHRLRHLRLLHGEDQRQGAGQQIRTTSRARTTT